MSSMSTGSSDPRQDPSSPASNEPSTIAAFSPNSSIYSPAVAKHRSTILVHQKSPLLIATPPQVTRALAHSHPFLLPLNHFLGILSWTSGDPWESFLLLASFWGVTLYGDVVTRWVGPVVLVCFMIFGMYTRRYSPLSSTDWSPNNKNKGHRRKDSAEKTRHAQSLDEIVEGLKLFTSRCNILLDPFLRMTDFLSTQRTATSATTRPALTILFVRILFITPVWYLLSLSPLHLITTKRVVLVVGTLVLSWHSRPARIARTILWRSQFIRQTCTAITGLSFSKNAKQKTRPVALPPRNMRNANDIAVALAASRDENMPISEAKKHEDGIRFTFVLYENQRRWIGIGWTGSMLAYERANWTDEQLNPTDSKDKFELPEVEGGMAKWRWCDDSDWQVEGAEDEDDDGSNEDVKGTGKTTTSKKKKSSIGDESGWIYYDNKWKGGQPTDAWGRYTRRRKWYRDAELVETTPSSEATPAATPLPQKENEDPVLGDMPNAPNETSRKLTNDQLLDPQTPRKGMTDDDASSTISAASSAKRRSGGWFGRRRRDSKASERSVSTVGSGSQLDIHSEDGSEDDGYIPMQFRGRQGVPDWGVGEDLGMELG